MQALRPSTETKVHAKPRLPPAARGLAALGKGKRQRLAISDPIGPVKNSRGADFARSETLTIVPGIGDCGSDDSLAEERYVAATKAARRISASFASQRRLASDPTVAKSHFNATTTCKAPVSGVSPKEARNASLPSMPLTLKKATRSTSTLNLFPRIEVTSQDENKPPIGNDHGPNKRLAQSQIPKSRTMSVLHDLKASMSRPSPCAKSASSRNFGSASYKASNSSLETSIPPSSSRLRHPRPSLNSLTRSSHSTSPEPQAQTQRLQAGQISTAQPSAYWSGRFVALHDRFSSECLEPNWGGSQLAPAYALPQKSSTPDQYPPRASSMNPRRIPTSTTTSSLTVAPFPNNRKPPPEDEDDRCIRIFAHLNGLCTTADARRSLHSFQQAYARRHSRPALLPQGGSMEDKSFMNKLFGGRGRKGERRSLSRLRESTSRAAKRALPVRVTEVRGKRMTLN